MSDPSSRDITADYKRGDYGTSDYASQDYKPHSGNYKREPEDYGQFLIYKCGGRELTNLFSGYYGQADYKRGDYTETDYVAEGRDY